MACSNPWYRDDVVDLNGNKIPIPCGKCFCCRLDMQQSAINRMHCAWHSHQFSAFVTFTYDDQHLRFKSGFSHPTLLKEDLRKYFDKVRHFMKGVDFEYYACGEYGDKFNRPHYHVLFFGLDFQIHKKYFEDSWKLGSVMVLPVKPSAFRYVAKYLTKGYSSDYNDRQYYDFGLEPPFRKMSRGLGVRVYLDHLDDIEKNGYFVFMSRKISVNRYFFNKLMHYSDSLVLNREKSIQRVNENISKEAYKHGEDVFHYRKKTLDNRESQLAARDIRKNSRYT